jgi:hypothetical protein
MFSRPDERNMLSSEPDEGNMLRRAGVNETK